MFEAVCVCLSVLRLVYDRSMKTAMFCISLLLLKLISVGLRPEFKKSLKVSTVQKPASRSLQLGKKKKHLQTWNSNYCLPNKGCFVNSMSGWISSLATDGETLCPSGRVAKTDPPLLRWHTLECLIKIIDKVETCTSNLHSNLFFLRSWAFCPQEIWAKMHFHCCCSWMIDTQVHGVTYCPSRSHFHCHQWIWRLCMTENYCCSTMPLPFKNLFGVREK